jgi:glutamate carboxypeptidase
MPSPAGILDRLTAPEDLLMNGLRVALSLLWLGACTSSLAVEEGSPAEDASQEEERIGDYVQAHADESIRLLERVANINSGTMNPEGVRTVGKVFGAELTALGFETRWISMPQEMGRAGHLFAERTGNKGKRILLIGHLDTVFEKDSPFQTTRREGNRLKGPGVSDMKGGDVVLLYALKALDQVGALEGTSITVALIGDEEKPGRPIRVARRDLMDAARRSDVALGFEGAMGKNDATLSRRGAVTWVLEVAGKEGHSSRIFSPGFGDGAIFEAARVLNSFREELGGGDLLTFNPGVILGGTGVSFDGELSQGTAFGKPNVIPQKVVVQGGLRFISDQQEREAQDRMREITRHSLPGTSAKIEFSEDAYPAMSPDEGDNRLLETFDRVSRDLGFGAIEPVDPGIRGAADISFVAPLVDALAGLGPVGSGSHSVNEDLDLSLLPVFTSRAAVLIYRLTR